MSYRRRIRRRFPAFRQRFARVALAHSFVCSRLGHGKGGLVVCVFIEVFGESAGKVVASNGVVLGDFL